MTWIRLGAPLSGEFDERQRQWERERILREFEIQQAIRQYVSHYKMESWRPLRTLVTPASSSWASFIERCRLYVLNDKTEGNIWLYEQDGWAFTAAIRFESAASVLAKRTPDFYWSGYYLIALLIERARRDLTFLEAIEALAVARLAQSIDDRQAAETLKQMGGWPRPRKEPDVDEEDE